MKCTSVLLMLLASSALAAPTLDSSGAFQHTSGVSSLTFAHTCSGTNRFLGVMVGYTGATPPTSVTYNGVGMTQTFTITNTASAGVEYWTMVTPPTGGANVVITFAATHSINAHAASWNGVHQTTPLGTASTATQPGGPVSVSMTPASVVGDTVIDGVATGNTSDGLAPTAGQTLLVKSADQNFAANLGDSFKAGAAGTTAMNWGDSFGGPWAYGGVAIKAAPATSSSQVTCGSQCPTATAGFAR